MFSIYCEKIKIPTGPPAPLQVWRPGQFAPCAAPPLKGPDPSYNCNNILTGFQIYNPLLPY